MGTSASRVLIGRDRPHLLIAGLAVFLLTSTVLLGISIPTIFLGLVILAAAVGTLIRPEIGLHLLVLNASTLGPLPMRPLRQYDPLEIGEVLRTNGGAQAALMIALADELLRRDGVVIGISSDAAVQHYETWGPYGASKAALDHLVLTFGEETGLATYAVDPGDMRTPMQQDAFPGEDISDRPLPESVVPRLLALLEQRPKRGRYLAADVTVPEVASA